MKSRILVSVVGIPVLVSIVLWAPTFVIALALVALAGIGAYEIMKCVGRQESGGLCGMTIVAAMISVLWHYSRPEYITILWTLYVVAAFIYAIVKAGEVKFVQILAGIFAAVIIPYSFSAFLRIEATGIHRAYLLLPFILSFACDTFAYFTGLAIGKHKLAPKVSPKKTIEGSIGGICGNVVCGCIFAFLMDRFFGAGIGYGPMIILALCCAVVAQVGDLSFSLIKREFGVKDYGKLFLEHGGVLDRFDSVLFVTPVIEIVLQMVK